MCCMRLAGNTGRKKSPFCHHRTTLSGYIFGTKAYIDNRKKNLLNSNTSSTCPDNMVNFGLLTAEICWRVWGTPANFNGFRVLAALLHGTLVVDVSQTLRHWTEGASYILQGGHHVRHWPTFPVTNSTSISCRWRTRATRCITANVLQIKVDAQCNKLATELAVSEEHRFVTDRQKPDTRLRHTPR